MDERLLVGAGVIVREDHTAEGDAAKHVDGDDTRRLLLLFDERLVGGLFRLVVAAQILHLGSERDCQYQRKQRDRRL